jgi:putative FmdB family regulatory protein
MSGRIGMKRMKITRSKRVLEEWMPIYEYQCKDCGIISEFLTVQGKNDPIFCRNCGSPNLGRILSATSFLNPASAPMPGRTCCGREERCEKPPCSAGGCRKK